MGLKNFDYNKQLITIIVITLSGFHCFRKKMIVNFVHFRSFCRDCGSRKIDEIEFVTHSCSREQLEFIFRSLLPSLRGKTVLDVGSRFGAVLYGKRNACFEFTIHVKQFYQVTGVVIRVFRSGGYFKCVKKKSWMLTELTLFLLNFFRSLLFFRGFEDCRNRNESGFVSAAKASCRSIFSVRPDIGCRSGNDVTTRW